MTSVIMVAIGAAMLVVAAFAFRLTSRVGAVAILLGAISLGLAYDNIAVAVGRLVGYGDTLSAINLPRFWIHAIAVPLLIVAAGNLVGRLGVEQARTRNVTLGGWALVVMLMVIGFVEDVVRQATPAHECKSILTFPPGSFHDDVVACKEAKPASVSRVPPTLMLLMLCGTPNMTAANPESPIAVARISSSTRVAGRC